MRRLVERVDEFDLQVIRSAIAFYNATCSDQVELPVVYQTLIERTFGWLPDVLRRRAEREAVEPSLVRWKPQFTMGDALAVNQLLLWHFGAFRGGLHTGQISVGAERITAEEWYAQILESINFESGLRRTGGETRFVQLPALTDPRQCVAYAIAQVQLRKLDTLVRPCLHLSDERPGSLAHHYFLADDARQKFCSPNHSNLYRQRKWQRDHGRPYDRARTARQHK